MMEELKAMEDKCAKLEALLRESRQKQADTEKSETELKCQSNELREEIKTLRNRM